MRKPDLETVRNLPQVTGQASDGQSPRHYSVWRTCSGTKQGEVGRGKLVLGIEAIAVWTGEGLPWFRVHGVSMGITKQRQFTVEKEQEGFCAVGGSAHCRETS